jgi:hypothetical protein
MKDICGDSQHMETSSKAKKLAILLWILTVVPIILVAITEANKRFLIGYMRIVDFVDLVITAPFFLIILLAIHATIYSGEQPKRLYWITLFLAGIFLYGHSMHMTANAINTFSTEIRNYREIIPNDTYSLIYFLDEDLGHWLLFLGLFGVLGLWAYKSDILSEKLSSGFVCGALFGIVYAVAIVESSQAWLGPILSIWLLVCNIFTLKRLKQPLRNVWRRNPMMQFTSVAALFILVGMTAYFFVMGSFIQPSQLGL